MSSSLRRVCTFIAICFVLVATAGSKPLRRGTAEPRSEAPEPVAGQEAKKANLEYLSVWVKAARESYARVRDYQTTFVKRERIDGQLQEEQTATMNVRTQPFSVSVKFVSPRAVAGKEASFVEGRNGGKMRAKAGGALGLVGFVTLDPRDPKAMQGTRHAISEAGIGHLIDQLASASAVAPGTVKPEPAVVVSEYTMGKRECLRFDMTDANADGARNQFRTLVYFDKETNLPVRYEAYDRRGEIVESFAYTELRFNIGLTDAAFP